MPMPAQEIVSMIEEALPGADVNLVDMAGDSNHYAAEIVYEGFSGLSRIKQHQMVYDALKGHMGGELHALALKTSAPK
ncbi:MAG: BolA family transcriptional regulator [Sphingomonadales bacterium]|nr:BolA family transcriptional regulator [Sphingomonadales bacterium]